MASKPTFNSAYERITARLNEEVCHQLKKGIVPWRQPWQDMGGAVNGISMKAYRGVNQMLLGCHPSPSKIFLSFKQGIALGGSGARKGSKGWPIMYWRMMGRETDANGLVTDRGRPMIKSSIVFALEDFDNIPADKLPRKPDMQLTMFEPIELAEQLVSNIKPKPVFEDSSYAAYNVVRNVIKMPDMFLFDTIESYYATLFHELGHWTGHATRLDRFGAKKRSYAFEELVAELTAAFLCVEAKIDPHPDGYKEGDKKDREQQRASYLAGWLQSLSGNPSLLVDAMGQAQKAAEYILGKVMSDTEIVTVEEQPFPLAA